MNISNFSFLKPDYSRLAELGKQAENYVHTDPHSVAFKFRAFSEVLVEYIYHHLQLDTEEGANLFTKLTYIPFREAVSSEIQGKLHAVRKFCNKAVHNKIEVTVSDALWLTSENYLIGRWFIQTIQVSHISIPEYKDPKSAIDPTLSLIKDNTHLKNKVDINKTDTWFTWQW